MKRREFIAGISGVAGGGVGAAGGVAGKAHGRGRQRLLAGI
jgi:hypothetical protein